MKNALIELENDKNVRLVVTKRFGKSFRTSIDISEFAEKTLYGMSDMQFGKALEYSNELSAALCVIEDAERGWMPSRRSEKRNGKMNDPHPNLDSR